MYNWMELVLWTGRPLVLNMNKNLITELHLSFREQRRRRDRGTEHTGQIKPALRGNSGGKEAVNMWNVYFLDVPGSNNSNLTTLKKTVSVEGTPPVALAGCGGRSCRDGLLWHHDITCLALWHPVTLATLQLFRFFECVWLNHRELQVWVICRLHLNSWRVCL